MHDLNGEGKKSRSLIAQSVTIVSQSSLRTLLILSSPFQFREGGEESEQSLLLPGDGWLLRVTLAQQGRVLNGENKTDSL